MDKNKPSNAFKRPSSQNKKMSSSLSSQHLKKVKQTEAKKGILKPGQKSVDQPDFKNLESIQDEIDTYMEKIQDLDELILQDDFQESLFRQTLNQQASLTENLETQKIKFKQPMTIQELQKNKVHFKENNMNIQCEILSLKKFRKLNEILAAKDLIIEQLQMQSNSDGDTRKLKKQIENLEIEKLHLKKNYEREKRLVEEKVRELDEFQAKTYDDTYSERQELMESKSISAQMEESLRHEKQKNMENKSTIQHLKQQLGQQMQLLGSKFKEVEQKHQVSIQNMQSDIKKYQEIKRMFNCEEDPIEAIKQVINQNNKFQGQIKNLQSAINVLQQEKQQLYNDFVSSQQALDQQATQSQYQFEYLQEEISSLRQKKNELSSQRENLKKSLVKIEQVNNEQNQQLISEIVNNLRSSIESDQQANESVREQMTQIQIQMQGIELMKPFQLDPNCQDLILSYQFSNDQESDFKLIQDVFQLLPIILQVLTLNGQQLMQYQDQNQEIDEICLENSKLKEALNDKDEIVSKSLSFAKQCQDLKHQNDILLATKQNYELELKQLGEQFELLESKISQKLQLEFDQKLENQKLDFDQKLQDNFQEAMADCDLESAKLQEINDQIRQELKIKNTQVSKLQYEVKDLTKANERLREEMEEYELIKEKFEKMTIEVKKIQAQVQNQV